MKKTVLHQIIIFIIVFFEVLLISIIPYRVFFGYYGQERIVFWGLFLIINNFILTFILLKLYKQKIKSSRILIWIILGTVAFLLPFSLVRLPWTIIGLENILNLLVGTFSAYGIVQYNTNKNRIIIIIMLTVLYIIIYFLFIYDALYNCCISKFFTEI